MFLFYSVLLLSSTSAVRGGAFSVCSNPIETHSKRLRLHSGCKFSSCGSPDMVMDTLVLCAYYLQKIGIGLSVNAIIMSVLTYLFCTVFASSLQHRKIRYDHPPFKFSFSGGVDMRIRQEFFRYNETTG